MHQYNNLPQVGMIMLVALASPLLIGDWLFSSKASMPNFEVEPDRWHRHMFSKNALVGC